MYWILIGYIAVSCLIYLVLFSVEFFLTEPSDRDPVTSTMVDLATAIILISGMIFLAVGLRSPALMITWSVLAPVFAALQIWMSYRDRCAAFASGEVEGSPVGLVFTDFGTLFLILPSLILNLVWAAG